MAASLTVIVDVPFAMNGRIEHVVWCPDGTCLLTSMGSVVFVWDAANPYPVHPSEWEPVVGELPGFKKGYSYDSAPVITYYRNTATGDLRLQSPSEDTSMLSTHTITTPASASLLATLGVVVSRSGHAGSTFSPANCHCHGKINAKLGRTRHHARWSSLCCG